MHAKAAVLRGPTTPTPTKLPVYCCPNEKQIKSKTRRNLKPIIN